MYSNTYTIPGFQCNADHRNLEGSHFKTNKHRDT